MGYGDAFWISARKREAVASAEAAGKVADSIEVRTRLIERMNAGELTLEQVQAELKRIKRGAKKAGTTTRARAWKEG